MSPFHFSHVDGEDEHHALDLSVRAATWQEFDPILALMVRQNLAEYGQPGVSAASLRARWQQPELDLAHDTWLAVAPDGWLAGYAELQRDTPARCWLAMYLAGGVLRQQLAEAGRLLLRHAEERALACAAVEIVAMIGGNLGLDQQVFEPAGYARELSFLQMAIDLAGPPAAPAWPDGIVVRTFVPGQDEQATYEADEEASADKGYHAPQAFNAWAKRMGLGRPVFDPSLWFLAYDGQDVAGVALNLYDHETGTGWVDHLGVRRRWRSRGLGLALLWHTFGAFYRRGVERVRLNVDAHSQTRAPRLYERAGMHTIGLYHIYCRNLSANIPGE